MPPRMSDPTYQVLLRKAARHRDAGRIAEAIAAYRQLLSRWPQSPTVWYNLAWLQRRAGRFEEALAAYDQALHRGGERPEEIHLNRALILAHDLHRYADAERELEAALGLNATYVPALMNLGNLHEDLGRREAAAHIYERILELDPARYAILARYAYLRKFSDPADPLIARLRSAVEDVAAGSGERAAAGFALGRALDACREYQAAFEAYVLANRLSRDSAGPRFRPYDRAAQERLIDRIIAAFPVTTPAPAVTDPAPHPIFVLGMFRSGSTLLEQLLAGHPAVTPGGELELLPQIAEQVLAPYPEGAASAAAPRIEAAASGYRGSLRAVFPHADLVTDKRPDNFLYIGLIKRLFPRAKIVNTVRDPLDNCLSVFFLHLDQRMSYALDLMDIAHYYGQYRRLMAHWNRLFASEIHDVDYDALVREPRPVMMKLTEFLGLEWSERCLQPCASEHAVRTASVWQVREPLYRSSSGRARHYPAQLEKIRQYLAVDAPERVAIEPRSA